MPEFTVQMQQETNWCWAAVGVAVNNYLDPGSAPPLTQAALATEVLKIAGVNCTLTPDKCNSTAALDDVLTVTGNLNANLGEHPLEFASLKEQIDSGLPVCAQIDWFEGGAHAIALDGYYIISGAEVVTVQDPLYGPSLQLYEDLVSNYLWNGVWAYTFTVKP
jgi:Papain-like cysteine protease AvrRpt2